MILTVVLCICVLAAGMPGRAAYATEGTPVQEPQVQQEAPAPQQEAQNTDVQAPAEGTLSDSAAEGTGTAETPAAQEAQPAQPAAPAKAPAPAKNMATKQTSKTPRAASTASSSVTAETADEEEDIPEEDAADEEDTEKEPEMTDNGLPVGKAVYLTSVANINLREKPSAKAGVLIVVPRDAELTATGLSRNDLGESWYKATYATFTGYVRDDLVRVRLEDLPQAMEEEAEEEEPELIPEEEPGEQEEYTATSRIITRKPLGETLNTRRRWTDPEGYEPKGVGDRFSVSKRLARREVDLIVIILAVIASAMFFGAAVLVLRVRRLLSEVRASGRRIRERD